MGGEPDQVRWRGVRPVEGIRGVWPARNATWIHAYGTRFAGGNYGLYVVPANKILFISSSFMSSTLSAAATEETGIRIRDTGLAVLRILHFHLLETAGQVQSPRYFSPAFECVATERVDLYVSGANTRVYGIIDGWLEDA